MTAWTEAQAALAATQATLRLPVIAIADVVPIDADRDVWDMWPIARADGSAAIVDGRQWWFFLAAPRAADPEARHDAARIRLYSRGADGWRDHGALAVVHRLAVVLLAIGHRARIDIGEFRALQ